MVFCRNPCDLAMPICASTFGAALVLWGFAETPATRLCQFVQAHLARRSSYGVLGAEPLGERVGGNEVPPRGRLSLSK